MMITEIVLCGIMIVLSAFFSGMEIAFLTSNKLKIELDKKKGSFYAQFFSQFSANQAKYLNTILVGNNIALVFYGMAAATILNPLIERLINPFYSDALLLVIQTVISTFVILIAAEYIPKILFGINPNRALASFSIPMIFFYYLLYPVMWITKGISEFVLKHVFRQNITERDLRFGKVDLEDYLKNINSDEGIEDSEQRDIQMFQNVIDFSDVKLRECMVPRTELEAIEITDSIANLREIFVSTELSRILVYQDSIDNIVGYVHCHDMFKFPENIKSILIDVIVAPETMLAKKLLKEFISQHKSIALIVDEFGGTSGIVTMEDVMEEIFGEIEDEHDVVNQHEKVLEDGKYEFSGRLEIDYINQKYHLNLPESDEYETLGGLIFHHIETIPHLNEAFVIENFIYTVLQVSDTRIEKVRIENNDKV